MTGGTGEADSLGRVDFDTRLVLERYRYVSRTMPLLYLAHAISGVAVIAASQGDFPFVFKAVLPALLMAACIYQFICWQLRARSQVSVARARRILRHSTVVAGGLCLTGGLWALAAYLQVSYANKLLPPFFAMVFGLATASSLAAMPRLPHMVLGLSLFPVTAAMLLRPQDNLQAIGFSLVVLTIVVLRLAAQHAEEVEKTLRLQDKLERQAWYDSLTGLANRGAFATAFENTRQDADESDWLALLIVDLDGFKHANDTYGHVAGDGVLVETAQRLQQMFADARIVARFGGDEFVLLFVNPNARFDWNERIEAARKMLSMPVVDSLHSIPISASFGLAEAPLAQAHLDQLLIEADGKLYDEKALRHSQVRRRA